MPTTSLSSFQNQLAAIMEMLAKTAVLEISKLVDIECKTLRSEVSRSHQQINSLRKRLQLMEHMVEQNQQVGNKQAGPAASSEQDQFLVEVCSRRENQHPIKRENQLEESNTRVPVVGHSSGESKKDQAQPETQSGHCGVHQKYGEKQSSEVTIKQEPNGIDLLNCEIEEQNSKEEITPACAAASTSAEETSPVRYLSCDTADRGIQTGKMASSADPLDRISSEDHLCDHEGPAVQVQASAGTKNTDLIASQSIFMPKSIRALTSSSFSGEKRFVCPHCSKRFKCFSQLEIHERSHTGEKPFRCTLCGKRYAQKGHLYTHQRTHTGEKPYRCLHCGKGFIQKCTLDMHQRTHTGEKPFICVKCGKGFTKKCNLNKHLTVHLDPATGLYEEPGLHDLSVR